MDRLKEEFGDRIDFVDLDVTDRSTLPIREKYGVTRKTTYALVDQQDQVVEKWIGPLDEAQLVTRVEEFLEGD